MTNIKKLTIFFAELRLEPQLPTYQNLLIDFIIKSKRYITVSDRALIFPTPLLSQLQGWPGCQKIQFIFLQINLFSFCARIEPKLSKLQKTVKIDKRSSKKPCFLIVFRIFSILGSILAQKTTKSKYLSIVPFICHPGHP